MGGYLFIAVSGLLFVAIGILASALARNQAVAGFLCFFLLSALIWGVDFLAHNPAWFRPRDAASDPGGRGLRLDPPAL